MKSLMKYFTVSVALRVWLVGLGLAFFPGLAEPPPVFSQNGDERIEIVRLGFSEEDDQVIDIFFRLDETVESGSVLFHRYNPQEDLYDEIDEIPVEDLTRDQSGRFFLFHDDIPELAEPPFIYYLAFDRDGEGADAYTFRHQASILQQVDFDLCRGTFELQWGHYLVMNRPGSPVDTLDPLFTHYRVLLNGEKFALVDFEDDFPVQSHSLEIPGPGNYTLRVEAVDHSDPDQREQTSFSNRQEVPVQWEIPTEVSVDYVHVNQAGEAEVLIRGDEHHEDFVYRIYRSDNPSDGFSLVDEVMRPDENPFLFTDAEVDVSGNMWYYLAEVSMIDNDQGCEEVIETSVPESGIFLAVGEEIQTSETWEVHLEFFHESGLDIMQYDIARQMAGEEDFQVIAEDRTDQYQAVLTDELPYSGEVLFRVEGVAADGAGRERIFSNVVSVHIEPEVNIPNAFRPDGGLPDNKEFRPLFVGFEPDDYHLVVLDRNGLEMFSSGNYETGWDGTKKGNPLPHGVYFYHLRYTDPGGQHQERSGVVYLVR